MWKLVKPEDNVRTVYSACISNIKNKDLVKDHETCIEYIANETEVLEDKIKRTNVHTVEGLKNVGNITDMNEIIKLYKNKMVAKTQPGRVYYDKILNLAHYETCPLCGQRVAETLDHYLPKTIYPQFSISPINLIPACRDCNSKKGTTGFENEFEVTIHPYFDDIDSDIWLICNVVESDPISFMFCVVPPFHWDKLLKKRIQYHFDQFELNRLYTAHAAKYFNDIRRMMIRAYNSHGESGVKNILEEFIQSEECNVLNSWRLAMLRALKGNEWFLKQWFEMQIV